MTPLDHCFWWLVLVVFCNFPIVLLLRKRVLSLVLMALLLKTFVLCHQIALLIGVRGGINLKLVLAVLPGAFQRFLLPAPLPVLFAHHLMLWSHMHHLLLLLLRLPHLWLETIYRTQCLIWRLECLLDPHLALLGYVAQVASNRVYSSIALHRLACL